MAEDAERYGHEAPLLATRLLLGTTALLVLLVLIALAGNYAALRLWLAPRHAEVMARPAPIPPPPRLQPGLDSDLAALRANKHALLSTYAWTDASHDRARIPIERAMAIYAQQQAQPASAPQGTPR